MSVCYPNYASRRRCLIMAMGGKCEYCGSAEMDELQFHHIGPRTWVTRQKNRMQRLRLYLRDWKAGILDLACGTCNKVAGSPGQPDC